ncbi:MAG: hypothetical protein LBP19_08635 [Treponema sp.]|nr:hypothetical protein [Treponema sp.]
MNERGKIRHIKSIHISERVVQKCLCDRVLTPLLSHPLIYDNGASVKGKGVHFALRRLIYHLTQFYRTNGSNDGYALIIDFSKFFDTIDHETLFRLVDHEVSDLRVRELFRRFVSVFGEGVSLGLGSQVSQIAAIFYPNRLDHSIKERLRIRYYGRYLDDIYLIHPEKTYLQNCLHEIERICTSLKIKLNAKKTRIVRLSRGIDFLKGKYTLLPSGRVLRRPGKASTVRMKRKIRKFAGLIDCGNMSVNDARTAYQAWRGSYKRCFNAYHRVKYMDELYNKILVFTHTEHKEATR